ncbi:hypothetical protein ACFL2D_02335 [Patescibacteria group bacterium]
MRKAGFVLLVVVALGIGIAIGERGEIINSVCKVAYEKAYVEHSAVVKVAERNPAERMVEVDNIRIFHSMDEREARSAKIIIRQMNKASGDLWPLQVEGFCKAGVCELNGSLFPRSAMKIDLYRFGNERYPAKIHAIAIGDSVVMHSAFAVDEGGRLAGWSGVKTGADWMDLDDF